MILHAIMILVEDTRYSKCVDEDSSPFRMPQRGMYFAGSILLWKENENQLLAALIQPGDSVIVGNEWFNQNN